MATYSAAAMRAWALAGVVLAALLPAAAAQTAAAPVSVRETADVAGLGYIGSPACRGCHTYLYERWRETRHARSILPAAAAAAAGYPLPLPRAGGTPLTIKSWADVAFVFGGKQRVAYVGSDGRVADSAYHHRLGTWRSFPDAPLERCARCHATSPKSTGPGPLDVAWSEPAVGCEACHGPGASHVMSLDARDIRREASSRLCGQCHTLAGAVLPRDERHLTHDLVQVWHADAHFTGVRRHSHDAFCARCHSPFEARGGDAAEAAAHPVWSEAKNGITCIGCHNPHNTSNAVYAQPRYVDLPPRASRRHLHTGNDQDFTSVDYAESVDTETACRSCHRGADRVVLDHADATCNDCHISYRRIRERSSRVLHDANRPGLACRPCHDDADRRLTLLYSDAGFLDAANVHDLRRLPPGATRHAPLYIGLPPLLRPVGAGVTRPDGPLENAPAASATMPVTPRSGVAGGEALGVPAERHVEYLLGAAQRAMERDDGVGPSAEVTAASKLDDPGIFLTLPIEGEGLADRGLDALRALPLSPAVSRWLDAYLNLRARQAIGDIDAGAAMPLRVLSGIDALMAGDLERAARTFARAAIRDPDAVTPKLGSALTDLLAQRLATGLRRLESLRTSGGGHPVVDYFIGRVRLLRGEPEAAIVPLEAAVRAGLPVDARFALARAYAVSERHEEAFAVYGTIIDATPDSFRARIGVAMLAKRLADRAYFARLQLIDQSLTGSASQVRDAFISEQRHYERVAMAELDVALRLRPGEASALRQVGEILRRQQDLDGAAELFESLARRFPEESVLFYRLGIVEVERGRLVQAAGALETALRLAPDDADAYQALAIVALRQDDAAAAAKILRQALLFEPFSPAIFNNLGVAYARLGDLQSAAAAFERGLELGTFPLPRRHLTLFNLARVNAARGDYPGRTRALARALHAKPDFAPAVAWMEEGGPPVDYQLHDLLERFGEVSTASLGR